jgi:hypothetical protein
MLQMLQVRVGPLNRYRALTVFPLFTAVAAPAEY